MTPSPLRRILLVEDDSDILEIATLALETIGEFTVETCNSGLEVVEKASRFKPDLILLDVMMPGMDGPSTLKALRATREFEETPIIFMTAKVMKDEIEQLKQMGALGVIAKPFEPETLSDQIKAIWEKRAVNDG